MEPIKLMIAEDHKLMRETLYREISEDAPNIEIIGVAENGQELLKLVRQSEPDVILLDIFMPLMSGLEVLAVLKKEYPAIRSIIFSSDYSDFAVGTAVLMGAAAYLDKVNSGTEAILAAIEAVHNFGYYFNHIAAKEIIKALEKDKKIYYLIEDKKFSEREIEVIRAICMDKQVKEIAAELGVSNGAIKYHKGNLFKKTESDATVDLVMYAVRHGIYIPSEKKQRPKL